MTINEEFAVILQEENNFYVSAAQSITALMMNRIITPLEAIKLYKRNLNKFEHSLKEDKETISFNVYKMSINNALAAQNEINDMISNAIDNKHHHLENKIINATNFMFECIFHDNNKEGTHYKEKETLRKIFSTIFANVYKENGDTNEMECEITEQLVFHIKKGE